jgi:two-component system CheB/CheR fusion protein
LADNSFTHLVVVGSSAGGIGALSGLVSSLPEDFDAPIVVAQHLDPNRESHLQQILARKSPLPVKSVTEHEPLQAGVVFVVPSNRHVNITDSEIDLSSEPSSGQPMPSINLLMETAAGVYGENLIAIVLSGTGTDGTEGPASSTRPGVRSSYRTLRPPSSARCRARWPLAPSTSSLPWRRSGLC